MSAQKLTLIPLTALVVGSMIGSGIFDLPRNMAEGSGALGIIIGWIITGLGMLALAFTFQILSRKRAKVEGSVYGYARAGFGDYVGFNSAFGYWISAWVGNLGYFVMIFSALGYFFPIFGKGNNILSIICESILLWGMCLFILRGITGAAFLNSIITVAKFVPLLFFIVLVIFFFNWDTFKANLMPQSLGSLTSQIKSTMLVTVFVFIGIEGASIYSSRAKNNNDVGIATVFGFIVTIVLLIAISLLSLGVLSRDTLLSLQSPSTAGILGIHIGYIALIVINGGIVIAVVGALLSWVLLATEMPYLAGKNDIFPKVFSKVNKNDTPAFSLIFTCIFMQIFLLFSYVAKEAYYLLITLSASMILIPYLLTGLFFFKEAITNRGEGSSTFSGKDLFLAIVASVFGIWLIYAGGLIYLLLAMVLYGFGLILYIWAKLGANKKIFNNKAEIGLAALVLILFVVGIIYLSQNFSALVG